MKPLTGMADRFSELKAQFSVKTGAVNIASGRSWSGLGCEVNDNDTKPSLVQ